MKKVYFFLTIFLTSYLSVYSQVNYEFYGALKLNGNDKQMITYKLIFTENKGKINGYTVTDLDGPHETKNSISGFYDKKNKIFSFQEEEILYTKSKFDENSFCFVNFKGKVKLVEDTSKLEGDFKGLFNNKTKCIDGTMALVGSSRIYNLISRLNKKIQKSKKLDEATKEKYNPYKLIDSLKINRLTKNQELTVFWRNNNAKIAIWDNGKEDGDVIDLYHNDKLLLNNYKVTTDKRELDVRLVKKNIFKIVAVNEGQIKTNTVKIELTDEERSFDLLSNLDKGESAIITIVRKE
jgi:hypothetical protein